MANLKYLWYVLRHKYFVFRAGLVTGAPLWRLIIHDWSKFTPAEWKPYVMSFYGPWSYKDRPGDVVMEFDRAWLHHQHHNPHHWQHWVLRNDDVSVKAIQMPHQFAREMVADWAGAGRAITGKWDLTTWYERNRENIILHPQTEMLVDNLVRLIAEETMTAGRLS